tara:strand:- start:2018 stop:2719 length:702 start_codon:yes stop_codon:yes gene_type:complete
MKLSSETTSILKNFATINQNLMIKKGKGVATMSAMRNIVASAKVEEEFPINFAIYDLNEFLAALSLFEKPDLDFKEDFVVITENGSTSKFLKYWYSDPSVITKPTKEITMPECEISFSLENELLSNVQKAAAVIGVPDMVLEADMRRTNSDVALLKVTDKKNATANDYAVKIDVNNNDGKNLPYKFWFKVENLKLLPGKYDVGVSSKNISQFVNKNVDIQYFIALEPESKYDA